MAIFALITGMFVYELGNEATRMASVRLIKHNEGCCCDIHLQEDRDFSVGHKSCLLYTQLVSPLCMYHPVCVCDIMYLSNGENSND